MTRAHGRYGGEPPTRAFHTRADRRAAESAGINVYAMVALIAALMGLFPVALVFGVLAFSRPGGRGMPGAAIALGVVEVFGLVLFLALGSNGSSDSVPAAATATATTAPAVVLPHTVPTTTMAPLPPPPSAAPTTTDTGAAGSTTVTTTTATTTSGGGDAGAAGVAVNGSCDQSQNGMIGNAADGSTLVCTNIGENGGSYRWSPAGPLASGVHSPGSSCDPLTVGGLTGHTADGHAVACEGTGHNGTWQTG